MKKTNFHAREKVFFHYSTKVSRIHFVDERFPPPVHHHLVKDLYLFVPIKIHGQPESEIPERLRATPWKNFSRAVNRPQKAGIGRALIVGDEILAFVRIKLKPVNATEVTHPLMHFPLLTPGLAIGQRVISIS